MPRVKCMIHAITRRQRWSLSTSIHSPPFRNSGLHCAISLIASVTLRSHVIQPIATKLSGAQETRSARAPPDRHAFLALALARAAAPLVSLALVCCSCAGIVCCSGAGILEPCSALACWRAAASHLSCLSCGSPPSPIHLSRPMRQPSTLASARGQGGANPGPACACAGSSVSLACLDSGWIQAMV